MRPRLRAASGATGSADDVSALDANADLATADGRAQGRKKSRTASGKPGKGGAKAPKPQSVRTWLKVDREGNTSVVQVRCDVWKCSHCLAELL